MGCGALIAIWDAISFWEIIDILIVVVARGEPLCIGLLSFPVILRFASQRLISPADLSLRLNISLYRVSAFFPDEEGFEVKSRRRVGVFGVE